MKYDENGYDKRGFNGFGKHKNGTYFDDEGYTVEGLNTNGVNREGYNRYGYDKNGYDKNGFDKNGHYIDGKYYDKNGFDKEGYHRNGTKYDENGFDREGFDTNGYNVKGFNREGFNRGGYDTNGYDKDGYDELGYNKNRIDRDGFDKGGYNKDGYDRNGYNKEGFDIRGFDKNGFDMQGYDIRGNKIERSNEKNICTESVGNYKYEDDDYFMSNQEFREMFCNKTIERDYSFLSEVIDNIVLKLNSFKGCQERTWEDVYQWVVREHSVVYGNINTAVAGMEMVAIWTYWYYSDNFRGFVSKLHDRYSSINEEAMLNEIWNHLSIETVDYNMKLGEIDESPNILPAEAYRMFFLKARDTFSVNEEFEFNKTPMIEYSGYHYVEGKGTIMCVKDLT